MAAQSESHRRSRSVSQVIEQDEEDRKRASSLMSFVSQGQRTSYVSVLSRNDVTGTTHLRFVTWGIATSHTASLCKIYFGVSTQLQVARYIHLKFDKT